MIWGTSDFGAVPIRLWRALCAALALAVAALASPAFAAGPIITTSAPARATIVQPLTLVKSQDLDFGQLVATATAGTVVLDPISGARTASGGTLAVGPSGQPAKFAGQGATGQLVNLWMSANAITLTRSGGSQTMTMDTFTIGSNPATSLSTTPKTFYIGSSSGIFNFGVAGTLHVGANQASGTYVGTFTVNIQYQ